MHVKYAALSADCFVKYLSKLTTLVERKISNMLPQSFALVLDRCSKSSTYYLDLFATFPSTGTCGFSSVLLGFSPYEVEEDRSEAQNLALQDFMLEVFQAD